MSGSALMYGKFASNASEELFVTKMTPVPYPIRENDEIIGVAITAYHTYFLYKKVLCIFSKLNHELVHTIDFELRSGSEMKGVFFDLDTHSLVTWSNRFVYKIVIENEDKDVWKIYVDQGMYEEAVDFCAKNSSPELRKANSLLADSLYKKSKFIEAAEIYPESDQNFETISLKFIDKGPALQKFLETELKIINSDQKTQRTLITT
jgi:Pep3/Vps18/deep orange family.